MEVIGAGRRIPTSSPLLKGASWRARVARAVPSAAEPCCGRPLAAMADLTAALWSSRGGLEGAGEWMRTGVALQVSKGQGQTRRPVRTHVQNARSGRAQRMHARCSTKCQRVLESSDDAGS